MEDQPDLRAALTAPAAAGARWQRVRALLAATAAIGLGLVAGGALALIVTLAFLLRT